MNDKVNRYYNHETKKIKNNLRFMETQEPELYKEVQEWIKDDEITLETDPKKRLVIKFYCYIYKIQLPKCKHQDCNSEVKYQKGAFNDFCCIKCCNTSDYKQRKIKSTWDNKTEEEHQEKIKKFKETNLERFGVDNPTKSKKILAKREQNNINKYGVKNKCMLPEERKKMSSFINSIKHTINYNREQAKKTTMNNYNVDNPMKSKEVQEKSRKSNLKKYGVEYSTQKHLTNFDNWNNINFIKNNFLNDDNVFLLYEFMSYFNCDNPAAYKKLRDNDISINKFSQQSLGEKEVFLYIKNIIKDNSELTIKENERFNRKELDITVYKNNKPFIAVEYNGIYWHSYDKTKTKEKYHYRTRHIEKTIMAEEQGFQLFHIFENEWIDSNAKELWKSTLKTVLGLNERIFARKCQIKEVHKKEARIFLENNHLQGKCGSFVDYGLYNENELVSLMTFGKNRFRKDDCSNTYELIRFCNSKGLTIVGAASRLLKHFEKNHNPKGLISYANRRWSQGNLYHKIGFELVNTIDPNHYFIENGKLFHRVKYQAHKVKEILGEEYDTNLSGFDNAIFNLNLGVIWDSGNYTFQKTYPIPNK